MELLVCRMHDQLRIYFLLLHIQREGAVSYVADTLRLCTHIEWSVVHQDHRQWSIEAWLNHTPNAPHPVLGCTHLDRLSPDPLPSKNIAGNHNIYVCREVIFLPLKWTSHLSTRPSKSSAMIVNMCKPWLTSLNRTSFDASPV